MRIVVLTPTIRPGGLERVAQSVQLLMKENRDTFWHVGLSAVGEKSTLCHTMNSLLELARWDKPDVIIFLQDYIFTTRLFDVADFVYKEQKAFTFPVTKEGKEDWRSSGATRKIQPNEWEIDFAAIPFSLLHKEKFDTDFDDRGGFGWENSEYALRLNLRHGVEFYVEPRFSADAIDHDAREPHPFKKKGNQDLYSVKEQYLRKFS